MWYLRSATLAIRFLPIRIGQHRGLEQRRDSITSASDMLHFSIALYIACGYKIR
jgi:hypothetical protein